MLMYSLVFIREFVRLYSGELSAAPVPDYTCHPPGYGQSDSWMYNAGPKYLKGDISPRWKSRTCSLRTFERGSALFATSPLIPLPFPHRTSGNLKRFPSPLYASRTATWSTQCRIEAVSSQPLPATIPTSPTDRPIYIECGVGLGDTGGN